MARAVLRPDTVWTEQHTTGYDDGAQTITTTMLSPGVGAQILKWGFTVTATEADMGNDTITCNIFERGLNNTTSNFLGAAISMGGQDTEATHTVYTADGTGLGYASQGKCLTLGERLAISYSANTDGNDDLFITESASFTVWALWQL